MERAILSTTADIVGSEIGSRLKAIAIEQVTVGAFLTGVRLSSGYAGACSSAVHAGSEAETVASHAFCEGIRGCGVDEILSDLRDSAGVARAVGIATLNSLAQMAAQGRARDSLGYGDEVDALAAADVQPSETVVVVGAFVPFLRELRKIGARHVVLERDPSLLTAGERATFRAASEAPKIIPSADVLIITGATLMNETLGGLIELAGPATRIVIVGPTVPVIPDAFFSHGVDLVGSVRVTDPEKFMDAIARGGKGYHLFGQSAVKVVWRNMLSPRIFDRSEARGISLGYPAGARSITS